MTNFKFFQISGLCKALEMLMEPGEPVVVEDFVYAGTLAIMDPYKPDYRIVPGDSKGMRPDALRDVLSSGDSSTKPKFIYINPTGANPTGTYNLLPLTCRLLNF